MKPRKLLCITALTLLTALAVPPRLTAQHTRYKLIDFGPSGVGIPGRPLNNRGTVAFAGCGDPDCTVFHSFRWSNGVFTDLGALRADGGEFRCLRPRQLDLRSAHYSIGYETTVLKPRFAGVKNWL